MPTLTTVPTIDAIALNPRLAKGLSREALEVLLGQWATVKVFLDAELHAAIIAGLSNGSMAPRSVRGPRGAPIDINDRMMTVDEAAAITNLPRRWFYDHADEHAWIKRFSRKNMRISETGLRRWMATTED
jgi:hypothetical protein